MFPIQDSVPSRSLPMVTRALILKRGGFFLELGSLAGPTGLPIWIWVAELWT
jgi:hypothetical protein